MMHEKMCLFNKCSGPPKWKIYGISSKKTVLYYDLLRQKGQFQHFLQMNEFQISKHKKISCCIIDKSNLPSQGRGVNIFIFDTSEQYHSALYLEYSIHEKFMVNNCNNLITFLNFQKKSTFQFQNSCMYIKSTDRLKWQLFFDLLEFLLQKLNRCVIGSQFYFPLNCKYLIMNELRLLYLLQNLSKCQKIKRACMKTSNQWKISTLNFQKRILNKTESFQNLEMEEFLVEKVDIKKTENLQGNEYKVPSILQLKRKSTDSHTNNDIKCKTKRLSLEFSQNNSCHCKRNSIIKWKVFRSLSKISSISYVDMIKTKKLFDNSEITNDNTFNLNFSFNANLHSNNKLFIQNETSLNHDFSLPAINDCEKAILVPSLNKVHSIKKVTDSCSSEQVRSQPEFKHTADLDAFKDITPSLKNKQSPIKQDNYEKAQISTDMKYFSQETITAKTFTGEEYVACSSKSNLPNINFVSFQTAAGKSLKISETALKTAEKIFQEVCAENLDIFPVKDIKRPLKSSQRNKDSNLKEKECVDDDINSILPGSFFDDIPFDEKEIDWKHLDTTINVPVVKSDTANTVQPHKIRKSLGGRRSLKPYTLKK